MKESWQIYVSTMIAPISGYRRIYLPPNLLRTQNTITMVATIIKLFYNFLTKQGTYYD